jgi:hypothetical protein
MKKSRIFVLAISLLVTANIFAATKTASAGLKYICYEVDNNLDQVVLGKKLIITQLDNAKLSEKKGSPFLIEVYEDFKNIPSVKVKAISSIEDVIVKITDKKKKILVNMFLDELNQTTLVIDGKTNSNFDCN